MNTKRIILTSIGLIWMIWLSSYTYADISDLNIISRSSWWADESLRVYVPKAKTNTYTPQKPPTALKIKQNIAEKYLVNNFKTEFKVDKVVEKNTEGKALKWPLEYKYNKKKIVIHHTAWEIDANTSSTDEQQEIKNIYKYHAITRDRWDIGYNYLVWPSGKIYEWRYWWSQVVWAHAMWNNTDTIWISLLGNFDIQEPTQDQLNSLIDLIVEVSKEYNIDPYTDVIYHIFDSTEQDNYIHDITLDSIVWHGDIWSTSCPWANLKKHLPYIKEQVSKRLQEKQISHYKDTIDIKYKNKLILLWDQFIGKIKISDISNDIKGLNNSCKSTQFDINCKIEWDYIYLSLNEKKDIDEDIDIILWTNDNKSDYLIWIPIRYIHDIDQITTKLKNKYITTNSSTQYEKITVKISPEQAKEASQDIISVLLHELSLGYDKLDISCTNECIINTKLWSETTQDRSDIISTTRALWSDQISYNIWDKTNTANEITIEDSNWWDVIINNYNRKSYAGIPWNRFSGKLIIKVDNIKIKWSDQRRVLYINQLPFLDYMNWLAETNDSEEQEKINTLYLVSKNYAMFYMFDNRQDGMPDSRTYNLTDSPEINQKYVWAWFEWLSKKWDKAASELQDKYIYYNDSIAILPYFNCSAGFTNSASERFGWTDTPYLQSTVDLYGACWWAKWFNWHGVGMSWKWANALASLWYTYDEIVNYYYNGVDIR